MEKEIIDKYINELEIKIDFILNELKRELLDNAREKLMKIDEPANSNSIDFNNSKEVVNTLLENAVWGGESKGRFLIIRVKSINNQLKDLNITRNKFYEMLDSLNGAFRKNKEGKYTNIYSTKNSTKRAYKVDKWYLIQNNINYTSFNEDKEKFKVIDNKIAYVINRGRLNEEYIY